MLAAVDMGATNWFIRWLYDAAQTLPAYVSLAAVTAFALLLTLYASQRRDVQRLSAWMEREPAHPAADLRASEALLDRAEVELEAVLGADHAPISEPTLVAPPQAPPTPTAPSHPVGSPASRVTSERPALDRITTERAALQPHPRWHRLLRRVGQPRVLGAVALLTVVLGIAAIFGSERLLQGDGQTEHQAKPGAIVPGDIEVAVLNGTSLPGSPARSGTTFR